MAGLPTETEIQAQWRNAVAILEATRAFADDTIAPADGLLDVLQQSLEGEWTPEGVAQAAAAYRASLSSLVSPDRASAFLVPILREYAEVLTIGGTYRDVRSTMRALYERFHNNGLRVKSRNIVYDDSPDYGWANQGFGTLTRLVFDENGYKLEACHVERKEFRCRSDQNSGATKYAEVWEVAGERESRDALRRYASGSGERSLVTITSRNSGSGRGGSLLANSSFDRFTSGNSPPFARWQVTNGNEAVDIESSAVVYREAPGSSTHLSLRINAPGSVVTLRQESEQWTSRRLNPNTPYFFRAMVNRSEGAALGGNIVLRLGNASRSLPISSLAEGWNEVTILPSKDLWFRSFNVEPLGVEIEWVGNSSGYLLVDDVILANWDLIDGTYYCLRGSNEAWMLDDTITIIDEGGAPPDAKIQWWLFAAGYGYLPSSLTPTFEDPA
jgi:hypothetical protein